MQHKAHAHYTLRVILKFLCKQTNKQGGGKQQQQPQYCTWCEFLYRFCCVFHSPFPFPFPFPFPTSRVLLVYVFFNLTHQSAHKFQTRIQLQRQWQQQQQQQQSHDHHPHACPKRFKAREQKSSQQQKLCARKGQP